MFQHVTAVNHIERAILERETAKVDTHVHTLILGIDSQIIEEPFLVFWLRFGDLQDTGLFDLNPASALKSALVLGLVLANVHTDRLLHAASAGLELVAQTAPKVYRECVAVRT